MRMAPRRRIAAGSCREKRGIVGSGYGCMRSSFDGFDDDDDAVVGG